MTSKEPALLIGLVEAAVIAVIGVIAYVAAWDAELTALIITAAAAIVAVVGAFAIRRQVTPVVD